MSSQLAQPPNCLIEISRFKTSAQAILRLRSAAFATRTQQKSVAFLLHHHLSAHEKLRNRAQSIILALGNLQHQ